MSAGDRPPDGRAALALVLIAASMLAGACSAERSRTESPPREPAADARRAAQTMSGEHVLRVELGVLRGRMTELPLRQVTVADPVYLRNKRYEGYPLEKVVSMAFGNALATHADGEIRFICSDGYTPTLPVRRLDDRATLAIRDLDAPDGRAWVTFEKGREQVSPEPYYVVWTDLPAQTSERFPWPYNLIALELHATVTVAPTLPAGTAPIVTEGAALFTARCSGCHSINLVGGTLGPELNVPLNITEYWAEAPLRAFIADPNSVRAESRMPAFPDLTARDLDR